MSFTSCSFTGHRKIEASRKGSLTELLERALNYAYSNGCRSFFAGGALGFDTLAAEAVIKFREKHPDVRLTLVLPCKDQDIRWNEGDRVVYKRILALADGVEYVSDVYYDGCMKKRNERLVELCDVLIAYVGRSFGGSAQTLRMAKASGKTVYNLYQPI